jgi:hypothetical protein
MSTHRAVILECDSPWGRVLIRSHAMTPEEAESEIGRFTVGQNVTVTLMGKHLDVCDEVGRPGCYRK